jgi:hypothetical protein
VNGPVTGCEMAPEQFVNVIARDRSCDYRAMEAPVSASGRRLDRAATAIIFEPFAFAACLAWSRQQIARRIPPHVSDIFISYSSEDRSRVRVLADALSGHGWSVWWDRRIPAGKSFDQVITDALTEARCVVVVWSRDSVASSWVREEADEGRKRGVLIPVLIDEVRPPLGFGRIQAAPMIEWDGAHTSEAFQKLAADVAAVIGAPSGRTPAPETSRRRR